VRYFVQGVDARSVGALMPIMPVTPKATTNTQVVIYGQPGTRGIHSPRPEAVPQGNSMVATTQPSNQAPDWIFPSTYFTTADNMHPPMGLFRDNPMPVPAVPAYRIARVKMNGRRIGSQVQVDQPAVVQRWSGISSMVRGFGG
jgi:hypothetical protein